MQAGSETERQPLVVHSNPASGSVLGAKGMGAKNMPFAVPAGGCQDVRLSPAQEHSPATLCGCLQEFYSFQDVASRQSHCWEVQGECESLSITPFLQVRYVRSLSELKF